MGKITASREQLIPDPRYGSLLASKFINCLMVDGKKSVAQNVFYKAMDIVAQKVTDAERRAKAEREDEAIFVVELSYAAVFEAINIPQEALQPALLIEAPRLIFPFARAIVADLTRESSLPPLLIQPIDFVQLYQQKLGAQTAGQA